MCTGVWAQACGSVSWGVWVCGGAVCGVVWGWWGGGGGCGGGGVGGGQVWWGGYGGVWRIQVVKRVATRKRAAARVPRVARAR